MYRGISTKGYFSHRHYPKRALYACLIFFFSGLLIGRKLPHVPLEQPNNITCPLQNDSLTAVNDTRQGPFYHRCTTEPIPHVSGILETAQYLLAHPNCSFIRFGNGDVSLMSGVNETYQNYTPDLAAALLRSLSSISPTVMIGLPDIFGGCAPLRRGSANWWYRHDEYRQWFLEHVRRNTQYLNAKISSVCTTYRPYCAPVNEVYKTLRDIWKGKDIVILRGNNSQVYDYDIFDNAATAVTYYAPRYQAWSAYETLKVQLMQEDPSKLYILTCGPVCKVLALDLAEDHRRALDLGHISKDYDTCLGNKSRKGFFDD